MASTMAITMTMAMTMLTTMTAAMTMKYSEELHHKVRLAEDMLLMMPRQDDVVMGVMQSSFLMWPFVVDLVFTFFTSALLPGCRAVVRKECHVDFVERFCSQTIVRMRSKKAGCWMDVLKTTRCARGSNPDGA